MSSDEAWARYTDPETSWEAAESQTPDKLRRSQGAVRRVLYSVGPCTDQMLVACYNDLAGDCFEPPQSESGIRTRRKELARQGYVIDTGERRVLPSGRRAIVWKALR